MKKSKNGITLIALVITIIVLLILAGISISLVTGQNGVLTRAEDASSTYSMASAKEQANMRAAGYVSEYMEKVYVDNDLTVGAMTTGEYVLNQINGKEDGDYRYSVSESTITVTSKTTGEALVSGTIGDDGGITWSDTVASGGNTNNNTNNNTNTNTNTNTGGNNNTTTQSGISVSEITASNYGQYVDLGTSILPKTGDTITLKLEGDEQPLSDWRIFLKDENGVWLILADYMPTSAFSVADVGLNTTTSTNKTKYGVCSYTSATTLINGLNGIISGKSNWNGLISGSDLYDNGNLINNNIQVKGAFDLNQWITSWNANSNYSQLESIYYESAVSGTADAQGYKLSGGYAYPSRSAPNTNNYLTYVNIDSTIGSIDYNDTLYFPHHTDDSFDSTNYCDGYWLASPAASSDSSVMQVRCNGCLTGIGCTTWYGVRPAVYLPSNIQLDTSGAVWTVVN